MTTDTTYTIEMARIAAEKLPPANGSPKLRERLAVLHPDSLIPVTADLTGKVAEVRYEYVDFVINWFGGVGRGGPFPRWIVEAHPEWGPMGH